MKSEEDQHIHRQTVSIALIALLFLTIGTSASLGQPPPGPVVRHLFRTAGLAQPYLLPWDAPLSRPEPQDTTPLPRPFVSYQFKTDLQPMAEAFDAVQQVLDFAPGTATPVHTHPGILVVTVLAGELTFNLDGTDTVYKEGESFVEVPGQVAQARNASTAQTSVMVSYVIPKDAPLSTVQHADPAPAALPATGEAAEDALPIWPLLLAASGLITGGWFVWRRQGRA